MRLAVAGCYIFMRPPNRGCVVQLSPIRAVIVARSFCAEQSQVFVSPRQYLLKLSTAMELGSYTLLDLLLSKECPARSGCRFLCLIITTWWHYRLGEELGSYLLLEVLLSQEAPARSNCSFLCLLVDTYWDLSIAMEWGSYPLLELSTFKESPARSSCCFFSLIVITWWLSQPWEKLGSYPLLEVLLSQETPARSSCRLLYLFVDISRDSQSDGVEQLSPIRAVIVTRSSCAEQSQVFMPPR